MTVMKTEAAVVFDSIKDREDFRCAFEMLREAIASPPGGSVYGRAELVLRILIYKNDLFRLELDATGESGRHQSDMETFAHCAGVLLRYFDGNPGGLTEQDALIYPRFLETKHEGFVQLADKLAAADGTINGSLKRKRRATG